MKCPYCVDGLMVAAVPPVVDRQLRMRCTVCAEVLLGPLGKDGTSARFWATQPNLASLEEAGPPLPAVSPGPPPRT